MVFETQGICKVIYFFYLALPSWPTLTKLFWGLHFRSSKVQSLNSWTFGLVSFKDEKLILQYIVKVLTNQYRQYSGIFGMFG